MNRTTAEFQGTMDMRVRRVSGERKVTLTVHVDEATPYDPVALFYLALSGTVKFQVGAIQLAMNLDVETGELMETLGPGAAG
ncbi:hypothetical protein LCGC14_3071290 [marine sediment metagenome]|uniref:Uncharacterized protein n=1 Tax=marine sediment metagenome TaxID=412755 RepID=A0A0F8Z6K6_9ZZZZ